MKRTTRISLLPIYNGGINVTDNTVAQRNLNVIVDNKGSVHFQENVDVTGAVSAEVKDGDITIGKTIKSGQGIDMKTGSGNITVGQDVTSGTTVNLTSGKGNITVGDKTTGTGNVTANGNVNLTVTEGNIDIRIRAISGSAVTGLKRERFMPKAILICL